jgi:hypothetical protein
VLDLSHVSRAWLPERWPQASLWCLAARQGYLEVAGFTSTFDWPAIPVQYNLVAPQSGNLVPAAECLQWARHEVDDMDRDIVSRLGWDMRFQPGYELPPKAAATPAPFGTRLRWCQSCLRAGFHASLFQHPIVKECPFHRETLVSNCAKCRAGWSPEWSRLKADPFGCPRCHCLQIDEVNWLPRMEEIQVNQALFEPTRRMLTRESDDFTGRPPRGFASFGMVDLWRFWIVRSDRPRSAVELVFPVSELPPKDLFDNDAKAVRSFVAAMRRLMGRNRRRQLHDLLAVARGHLRSYHLPEYVDAAAAAVWLCMCKVQLLEASRTRGYRHVGLHGDLPEDRVARSALIDHQLVALATCCLLMLVIKPGAARRRLYEVFENGTYAPGWLEGPDALVIRPWIGRARAHRLFRRFGSGQVATERILAWIGKGRRHDEAGSDGLDETIDEIA